MPVPRRERDDRRVGADGGGSALAWPTWRSRRADRRARLDAARASVSATRRPRRSCRWPASARATPSLAPRRPSSCVPSWAATVAQLRGRTPGSRRLVRRSCVCSRGPGWSIPRASTPIAARRICRAPARLRARPGRRDPGGPRREVPRPGRRRVSDGQKWEAVAQQPVRPHYVICNADESEPGTFKDRVLMEDDPFALVEAMTIAAFTATRARLSLHSRRVSAGPRPLEHAIDARAARLLGETSWVRTCVRPRGPARRGRLYLRRGDCALQLDRGIPRRAAQQASIPRGARALRQADGRQQRRDPRQHADLFGGGRVRCDRHGPVHGHEALLPLWRVEGRASTRCPSARRWALFELAGGVSGGQRCRRCCSVGPRVCSCGPDELDMPLTFEDARRRARRWVPAWSWSSTTRSTSSTCSSDCGVLPRRVLRPVRAVPGRDRAPGGGVAPVVSARCEGTSPTTGAARRDRPGDERRVDLRTWTDRVRAIESAIPGSACSLEGGRRGCPTSCSSRGGRSRSRSMAPLSAPRGRRSSTCAGSTA